MEIYRKMNQHDVASVYEIEMEAFSAPWSYEALMSEITNDKAIYIVVESDGYIIGYAGLWRIFDEGHITNIAIEQSQRGKGIGEKLMLFLQEYAESLGVAQFTLEVRVGNAPAIKLYEKLGYKIIGRRKAFYERPVEDAYIMWLK